MKKGLTVITLAIGLVVTVTLSISRISLVSATACSTEPNTYESNDGRSYTVLQFKTVDPCEWTVPQGVIEIQSLVVGGGGAGGTADLGSSGGGGGGQVVTTTFLTNGVNSFSITVGADGIPTPVDDVGSIDSSGDGGSSSITPSNAPGTSSFGGGGGANSRLYLSAQGQGSKTGWTGGGGSVHASTRSFGSTGVGGVTRKGGDAWADGSFVDPQAAGGGGGADGAGSNATSGAAGAGGKA